MMHLKNAVIYCRVSTKEQVEEGNSLSTQGRMCREYAAREGYQILEAFIEQGESAKTQDRRELQRMMTYCSKKINNIQAVITYKIDRISRNMDDYSQIRLLFRKYGVEIKSTSEQFTDSPVGRFLENTLASISEFDNAIRTERSVNGMRDAVRQGRYVWMAPVGYENVRINGKGSIRPSAAAPLIKEMFNLIAQGTYPVDEVRKIMHKKGLMNNAGKPITRSHFYTLVTNKLYAGVIEKFGERHIGTFESIISIELFEHVQRIIKKRGRRASMYRYDRDEVPLRRFVTHPAGHKLTGYTVRKPSGKNYVYYEFKQIGAIMRSKDIHTEFASFFDSFSMKEEFQKPFFKAISEAYTNKHHDIRAEKLKLSKRVNEIQLRKMQLVEKNLKGIIPDSITTRQLLLLENEEVEVKSQLYALKDDRPIIINEIIGMAKQFLKKPSKYWLNCNLEQKLAIQKFVFPQVVTYDGNKFRTDEISLIFKANADFLSKKSSRVHLPEICSDSYIVQCEALKSILSASKN